MQTKLTWHMLRRMERGSAPKEKQHIRQGHASQSVALAGSLGYEIRRYSLDSNAVNHWLRLLGSTRPTVPHADKGRTD